MSEPAEVKSENRPGRPRGQTAEEKAERKGVASRLLVAPAVLGVVYGDLGTSAIYSLHAVFTGGAHLLAPSAVNVLGIVSLVFWTLIVIVSLKYMTFVLRADNRGEGGTFALIALLRPWRHIDRLPRRALVLVGLAGAAMLYAGVMITPAISILSAVEGLKYASPEMQRYVIPVTLVILVLLFAVQRFGTARVGAAFGPIMALWFLAIAALGVYGILQAPQVITAINPLHAIEFFRHDGLAGFLVLFAVFLVTTGVEALYADIGHFGPKPIRWLWFVFVLPALLLNYFGQGALLLVDPKAASQPFFHLIPPTLLYPMVVLATLATIIASQAAITGSFSMTRQAGRLGMMPRSRVVQTSEEAPGQVYVPMINWVLMAAAIILVVLFKSSDKLASTYGISVSTAMVVTTILLFFRGERAPPLAAVDGGAVPRRFWHRGSRLFRLQRAPDSARRLVPDRGGRAVLHRDVDVAARRRAARARDGQGSQAHGRTGQGPCARHGRARARYRGVRHAPAPGHTARALPPHRAQPRTAKEGGVADRAERGRPAHHG